MFCTNCGTELPDGSRFCTACGAQVGAQADAQAQTAPAADYQPPAYQQQAQQPSYTQQPDYAQAGTGQRFAQTTAVHPEYKNMGGWLLFFMIIYIIDIVYLIISGVQGFMQMGEYGGYIEAYFGGGLAGVLNFTFIWGVIGAILYAYFVYLVFTRKTNFLRMFQIISILNIVVSLIIMLAMNAMLGEYASYVNLGGSMAGTLIGGIAGLILMTLYFCRSLRVNIYMGGSDEYKNKALFRIGQPKTTI